MRQHDHRKLKLNRDCDSSPFRACVTHRGKPHGHSGRYRESQHVHCAEQVPHPEPKREQESQWAESMGNVVTVKIRTVQQTSGNVMMIESPGCKREGSN